MIQLALRGYSKLNPSADSRLPITLPILEDIILACEHTKSSLYSRKLIQAMYAIAFFAALRVGEITSRAHHPRQNIIAISQTVFLKTREGTVSAIKLTLKSYKHSDASNPVDIFIYREKPVCPVSLLLEFLFEVCGTVSGTSFLLAGCLSNISIFLCCRLNRRPFCNLSVAQYKTRSFRIGAASWAAAKGMSDTQIRAFGRWISNAFLRYMRPSTMGIISAVPT